MTAAAPSMLARKPLFVEPRRGWQIQLRDIHTAGVRGWFCSLIDPNGKERILVRRSTPTDALAHARAFIDDADTVVIYRKTLAAGGQR